MTENYQCFGIVTDVNPNKKEFTAMLSDNHGSPCKFGFDMLKESDQGKISAGDTFIWSIGYNEQGRPSCRKFSEINLSA